MERQGETRYWSQSLRLISRNEAAEILGCNPMTISNWIANGILKARQINRAVLVDRDSIEQLLDTATEVAEMEQRLKDLKNQLKEELEQREEEVLGLRNCNN